MPSAFDTLLWELKLDDADMVVAALREHADERDGKRLRLLANDLTVQIAKVRRDAERAAMGGS